METQNIIITAEAGTLSANFEEMKTALAATLEEYQNAVFTDDSIKSAKSCVAELRKGQKAFKDRVTEVKKAYMLPYDNFKAKADEIIKMFDAPISFIDGQVKDFEERRRADRRADIGIMFVQLFGDLAEKVDLSLVYDSRWENATCKIGDIKKELTEKSNNIFAGVTAIRGTMSTFTETALEGYYKNLDLPLALNRIREYEQARAAEIAAAREREKQALIEDAKRQERERIEAEAAKQKEIEKAKEAATQEFVASLTPEDANEYAAIYVSTYEITMTEAQKTALEMYMDSVGIDWKQI